MYIKDLKNDFVVREIPDGEFRDILKDHFDRIFQNRLAHSVSHQVDDTSALKIKERAQSDRRFRMNLVLFYKSEPIGWHFGHAMDAETYYMQNSAILENYRNKGLYTQLLHAILEKLQQEGFQVATSTHHANNAAVLVPKLKAGFMITSVQFHEKFRFLVELKYIFNVDRRKAYGKNMGLEL